MDNPQASTQQDVFAGMKSFMVLWLGQLISAVGSGLTSFGLGIYVYRLTGQATALAMVTLAAFLPTLLLSIPAGVWADRYDRRLLMLIGDSFSALGIAFIWLCMEKGELAYGQILVGVIISSVFSALMEPAYKATVSDLLSEKDYAKASGLVQLAGGAKFLIAPVLAGFLLAKFGLRILLILDIATFFVTAATTAYVKQKVPGHTAAKTQRKMGADLVQSYRYMRTRPGLWVLLWVSAGMTFCLGFLQTLAGPMILAFADERTAGSLQSIMASGILFSGMCIGLMKIEDRYLDLLTLGFAANGLTMACLGIRPDPVYVGCLGFLFFATLPWINTGMECLVRKNLAGEVQGRVWGMIGIVSQSGYLLAYLLSGFLADRIFSPLFMEEGRVPASWGRIWGYGTGRGIGFMISLAGCLIIILAWLLRRMDCLKELELGHVEK